MFNRLFSKKSKLRRNRRRNKAHTQVCVEALEERVLLSSISLSDAGVLTIEGTAANENVTAFLDAANTLHVVEQIEAFPDVFDSFHVHFNQNPVSVNQIVFNGRGGNDVFDANGLSIPLRADGGAGNDEFTGSNVDDVLFGGPGDDLLLGRNGNDKLRGGDGEDVLEGGAGNDLIFGGAGNDKLYGDSISARFGPIGNDELHGGAGADFLRGGKGNDVLFGNADNDSLFGDASDDLLRGGGGSDTLNGGTGDDVLLGGGNIDTLNGGAGFDINYLASALAGGDALAVHLKSGGSTLKIVGEDGKFELKSGSTWTVENSGKEWKFRPDSNVNFKTAGSPWQLQDWIRLNVTQESPDQLNSIEGFTAKSIGFGLDTAELVGNQFDDAATQVFGALGVCPLTRFALEISSGIV